MANIKCDVVRRGRSYRVFRYWLPLLSYAWLIFHLSSISHVELPSVFDFPNSDKVIHFFEYGGLGFLCVRAIRFRYRDIRQAEILAFFLCLLYGATDEIHQLFVPGRNSSLTDLLADGIGAAVGAIFYFILRKQLYGKNSSL
ncbi:MAG: VanZ family protein [Deltaproteobacteria bacterium]|nr:VanZ family protein [Deltaproteobacteria bacterium]